jgi:multicomponent Na+:H+ antiporter subunit C
MELPMAAAIAVLFAAGTYMILRPNLIRLAMGFGLYSNATNLLLITIGGYTRTSGAPFVGKDPQSAAGLMDPLPPDIILTAIVISFAVGALTLIICYRVYQDHGTDDPQRLPTDDEYDPAEETGHIATGRAFRGSAGPGDHPPVGRGMPAAAPVARPSAKRRRE